MSFLYPLFLLGGLAIALPIVFHLARRSTREAVPFSALLFLDPSPPRLTRRNRLEHLWLLILRCLALLLTALAFARPFLKEGPVPEPPAAARTKSLILIDSSASMKRPDLWDQAQDRARLVLGKLNPASDVALYRFDDRITPIVSFEQWRRSAPGDRVSRALALLRGQSPTWHATDLGKAFLDGLEALEEATNVRRTKEYDTAWKIYLISDLQAGSRLASLQGFEWPERCEVQFEVLSARHRSNAGIQALQEPGQETSSAATETTRVRISNAVDSGIDQFSVRWGGSSGRPSASKPVQVYVPAGKRRIIDAPPVPENAAGDRLELLGDQDDFDNTAWFVPMRARQSVVLFLGDTATEGRNQLLFYLQKAYQQTRRHVISVRAQSPEVALLDSALKDVHLIVVAAPLTPSQQGQLRHHVESGETLLVVLTSPRMTETLKGLLQIPDLSLVEAASPRYALLGQIAFDQPIFAPFDDPRYNDFTKIHFWRHRRLQLPSATPMERLAAFDNNDPALLATHQGQGEIFILTTSWLPADSQLALSTKFVPLLYAILDQGNRALSLRPQYRVGDAVDLTSMAGEEPLSVLKPDGNTVPVKGEPVFSRTENPGIYTVVSSRTKVKFSVNLAPSESDTTPMELDALEQLGIPMQALAPAEAPPLASKAKAFLKAAEIESQQKLWRWLILVALLALLLETLLGRRFSRRSAPA